ncbi:MAG: acyl-CoA thioesterase [Bdellovibrionales bacterium]|nr:acyl-CoA thioesterase [Bdellovibrionales bacterium]
MADAHTYNFEIKEHHLDSFGHVNHAVYLEICEEARWQLCLENNISFEDIHRENIGPIILEANVKYKKELKNREKIKILTSFKKTRDMFFAIHHKIVKENGQVSAEIEISAAIWDMKLRKLIIPPEKWQKLLL